MDYKSVIEEQIRELQKVQDKILKDETVSTTAIADEARKTAITIADLCSEATGY